MPCHSCIIEFTFRGARHVPEIPWRDGKRMDSRKQTRAAARQPRMKTVLLLASLAALLLATGCNKLRARDQLNKGVQAYKANRFESAMEFFKNAIDLDPTLTTAKLYLATACSTQYVPGAENEENTRNAECAIQQFKSVLEAKDTERQNRVLSMKGLASLYMNMNKDDQSKEYFQQAIKEDPNDEVNYYSIAFLDWRAAFKDRKEMRDSLGIKEPETPIKDKKACEELKTKNWDKVQEGIDMLNKALDLKKDYDDAMVYINLMYRERADLQCGDPEARAADTKAADEWVEKAKASRQAKADKAKEQHGIVLEPTKQ
jgi:tetratricopeptide (TPR) repeat protein